MAINDNAKLNRNKRIIFNSSNINNDVPSCNETNYFQSKNNEVQIAIKKELGKSRFNGAAEIKIATENFTGHETSMFICSTNLDNIKLIRLETLDPDVQRVRLLMLFNEITGMVLSLPDALEQKLTNKILALPGGAFGNIVIKIAFIIGTMLGVTHPAGITLNSIKEICTNPNIEPANKPIINMEYGIDAKGNMLPLSCVEGSTQENRQRCESELFHFQEISQSSYFQNQMSLVKEKLRPELINAEITIKSAYFIVFQQMRRLTPIGFGQNNEEIIINMLQRLAILMKQASLIEKYKFGFCGEQAIHSLQKFFYYMITHRKNNLSARKIILENGSISHVFIVLGEKPVILNENSVEYYDNKICDSWNGKFSRVEQSVDHGFYTTGWTEVNQELILSMGNKDAAICLKNLFQLIDESPIHQREIWLHQLGKIVGKAWLEYIIEIYLPNTFEQHQLWNS